MSDCKEPSLAAERARFAYRDVVNWGDVLKKRGTVRVRGLPVQVRTQGLQVTVAALMAESKPADGKRTGSGQESRHLADLLARWLLEKSPRKPFGNTTSPGAADARELLKHCVEADRAAYLAARSEAIALLDQIKTYADALYSAEAKQP